MTSTSRNFAAILLRLLVAVDFGGGSLSVTGVSMPLSTIEPIGRYRTPCGAFDAVTTSSLTRTSPGRA
jgi:hypothetical protein